MNAGLWLLRGASFESVTSKLGAFSTGGYGAGQNWVVSFKMVLIAS